MVRRNNAGKECCIAPAAAVWPLGVGYTTPAESLGLKAEETLAPALRECVRRFKTLVTPFDRLRANGSSYVRGEQRYGRKFGPYMGK